MELVQEPAQQSVPVPVPNPVPVLAQESLPHNTFVKPIDKSDPSTWPSNWFRPGNKLALGHLGGGGGHLPRTASTRLNKLCSKLDELTPKILDRIANIALSTSYDKYFRVSDAVRACEIILSYSLPKPKSDEDDSTVKTRITVHVDSDAERLLQMRKSTTIEVTDTNNSNSEDLDDDCITYNNDSNSDSDSEPVK